MSTNISIQRICQHCGTEFTARTTRTRYCSHACNRRAYKANVKDLKIELSDRETRRIKERPFDELKAREFLSITDTCKLLGISRRTVYRMLGRGELRAGKAGKRTIIMRSEIDSLFQ